MTSSMSFHPTRYGILLEAEEMLLPLRFTDILKTINILEGLNRQRFGTSRKIRNSVEVTYFNTYITISRLLGDTEFQVKIPKSSLPTIYLNLTRRLKERQCAVS